MKKGKTKLNPDGSPNPFADFQEINEQGDIFRQMFKYSVIPTIIHDMEMNIINANDRAVEEFGYSTEELLQKSIFDLHTEDELEHSEAVLNEMQQKNKLSVETSFKRKNGSVFFAEATPCKFLLGDKPVIHVFIQDITERKKAEKDLRASYQQLNRRNKELEEFTYLTSHDLQEPLNSIIAWASLLKSGSYELLDDTGKKSIDMIEKSSARMKDFIFSLLEYIRVGQKKEKKEVSVNELIKILKIDLADLLERENATINYSKNDISLMAYELDLIKLFQNIISNAIKFKKPNADPLIQITAKELNDCYEFSVTDNGIGIAQEH